MKLVSVIVATHKREKELEIALESLAKQSYSEIEIILVDDNGESEWNTRVSGIVNAFCERFPGIPLRYIVNESNQGSAKTRNIGIAAANGEYITFLDDDDRYLPDKIKKQVEFMHSGDYDYTITDLLLYSGNDKVIDKRIRSYIKDTSVQSLRRYHLKYHMTGTDTMMFKKTYLETIGGFAPIDVGDEFYLMQRAIDGGGKFGYLPGCDVKAYVHTGEGGLSSGEGKISGENALYEHKKPFFDQLPSKDIRYIKMRLFAVLAFAELRQNNYWRAVQNAAMALLVSPVDLLSMLK